MNTTKIEEKIQREINRITPLVSTSNNYHGAYRDGLRKTLEIIKLSDSSNNPLCESKWCLNTAIDNSKYCKGHQY